MLGVPTAQWFGGSLESGQMVLNKRRHWRGLVVAAWLNGYAHFWCGGEGRWGAVAGAHEGWARDGEFRAFAATPQRSAPSLGPRPAAPPRYEVFTCFLGKGDKETFAYGMAAAKEEYHVVQRPPGSLGTVGERARLSLGLWCDVSAPWCDVSAPWRDVSSSLDCAWDLLLGVLWDRRPGFAKLIESSPSGPQRPLPRHVHDLQQPHPPLQGRVHGQHHGAGAGRARRGAAAHAQHPGAPAPPHRPCP